MLRTTLRVFVLETGESGLCAARRECLGDGPNHPRSRWRNSVWLQQLHRCPRVLDPLQCPADGGRRGRVNGAEQGLQGLRVRVVWDVAVCHALCDA